MGKLMSEFDKAFPEDKQPGKKSGNPHDPRQDPESFWGLLARVKDLNMRAMEVYNEKTQKKKEASAGKAKKDEEKARTNEVIKEAAATLGQKEGPEVHDLREDEDNEGQQDEGKENSHRMETPVTKQGKSRGGCQG